MNTPKRLFLTVLCLFAVAGPGDAKNLGKKSLRDLRKACDQRARTFKDSLKVERSQLFIHLRNLDEKLKSGAGSENDVTGLFDQLYGFQVDVRTEINAACDDIVFYLQKEMQDLAAGNVPPEEYPRGFYYGEGGAMDGYRADLLRELDRTYAAVLKRVRKTGALFRSRLNRSLSVRMTLPTDLRERACRLNSTNSYTTPNARTVDLVIGSSDLSTPLDAKLLIAGSAASQVPLRLRIDFGNGWSLGSLSSDSNGRWNKTQTNLPEGNYGLQILDNTALDGVATLAIGVR